MTDRVTVAVDANGADLGPGEVARGAALAAERGIDVLLFGPAAELGDARRRRRGRRRPGLDRQGRRPGPRRPRATPDASIVQAARAVADGRAPTRSSPAARPAPRWPPACSTSGARAASTARRSRCRARSPGAPFLLLDVGANVEVRPEHLVQFAHMGAAFCEAVARARAPARRAALQRRGADARARATSCAAHAALAAARPASTSSATSRASRSPTGAADVVVTDGFTGNVALKLDGGHVAARCSSAIRAAADVEPAREARRRCCCGPRCGRCATSSTPRRRAAPYCSACASSASCRTARFEARGLRAARSRSPRAACARTWWGARTRALEAAGALRRRRPRRVRGGR